MWMNLFTVTRNAQAQTTSTAPNSTFSCVSQFDLSVVIPAFNEEVRLPRTLESVHSYLVERGKSFEIIVVDDGSIDRTADVVRNFSQSHEGVKVIVCPQNRGKGHALRVGVMSATGNLILLNDADGSTPIEELATLEGRLCSGAQIIIGSRAKPDKNTTVVTSLHRRFTGRVFNGVVQSLLLPDLYDTQCGFKLFTADAAHDLFSKSTIDGFGFDVEILHMARCRGYITEEAPVNWRNVEGSKVNLLTDSPKMLLDVLAVVCASISGKYATDTTNSEDSATASWAEYVPLAILSAFSMFVLYWFKLYAAPGFIPGNDLPGHIALVERMMPQLAHLRLTFYDPAWFSGWPACQFYAPLAEALTACLALLLSRWSAEPAQWACHIGLWLGCAALPWSLWYLALPLSRKVAGTSRLSAADGALLATSICFTSFWYLNHDYQWHGIGAAAVMNIGLYSQLLGWHFLLLHAGALVRWLDSKKAGDERLAIIFFGLLCFTHTLTSMFQLGFVLLLSIWYAKERFALWRMHVIGIGLACLWLFPAMMLSGTYAVPDIIRPQGDFFEILFRYPLVSLLGHIKDCLGWHFMPIDLATLAVDMMFILFLILQPIRRAPAAVSLFVAVLVASFLASSGFIASSFPLTVHYYRIYGYTLLYLAALLSIVPVAIAYSASEMSGKNNAVKIAAPVVMMCVLSGGLYSATKFPHYEREKVAALAKTGPSSDGAQVLAYFKKQPVKGRVFIESFDDYEKYPFLQARYLESRLWKDTGFETVNGLFIQSSQACRLADAAAFMAAGNTWNCPYTFMKNADVGNITALTQLKDFGVTHLICRNNSDLVKVAQQNGGNSVQTFGPYTIVQIAKPPVSPVTVPTKALIGYVDAAGNLPFGLMESYFFAHKQLYSAAELIDLTGKLQSRPPQIPIVIVNDKPSNGTYAAVVPSPNDGTKAPETLIRFQYRQYHLIDHYHVWYQHNFEQDAYEDVERCLDKGDFVNRMRQLLADRKANSAQADRALDTKQTAYRLNFADDNQTIKLSNLLPGQLVKVNYSYFPYWRSSDAEVFRASGERMYVLPHGSTATLRYDPWCSGYTWLGLLISLASLSAISGFWSRLRQRRQGS